MEYGLKYQGHEETEFNFDVAQLALIFSTKSEAAEALSNRNLDVLDNIYNKIRDYWKECDAIMSEKESKRFKEGINQLEELKIYYYNNGAVELGNIFYLELEKFYLELSLLLKTKGIYLREKKGRKELARELN